MSYIFPKGFVFTGPPCSGKSTTISFVARAKSWFHFEESARLLCERAKAGEVPDPRLNEDTFSQRIFDWQLERESALAQSEICLLDRGLIDSLGYARVTGGSLSGIDRTTFHRRYRLAFLFDPLPFQLDDARNAFDLTNREKIAACLLAVYREYGHEIVRVPVCSLEKRASLIVQKIEETLNADVYPACIAPKGVSQPQVAKNRGLKNRARSLRLNPVKKG